MKQIKFIAIAHYPAPIRLGIFVLGLLLLWLPLAVPIYAYVGDRNLASILTIVMLYAEFILLLKFWGKYVYQQPQLLRYYGLVGSRANGRELLVGLGIGLITVLSLFSLEGLLGWLQWQQAVQVKIVLEGLLVAIATGFAEELLFRGWLLDELQRDYAKAAIWINASLFAALHFIKPLSEMLRTAPQFPGLLLLGLTLVLAKRRCQNRLGLSIGIHGGLIWGYYIINVSQLIKYSGQVPDWVTGVNQNPLAGLVGVGFLSVMARVMSKVPPRVKYEE